METRHRPKAKLPKHLEIVPDMYTDLLFCDMSYKPLKIRKKVVHRPAFFKDLFITPSRGWQRVEEGDVMKWHTQRIQMHLFLDRSSDYFHIYFI